MRGRVFTAVNNNIEGQDIKKRTMIYKTKMNHKFQV